MGFILVGVVSLRVIYFLVYVKLKKVFNKSGVVVKDSKFVYVGLVCFVGKVWLFG